MELSNGMKIGIGLVVLALGGFAVVQIAAANKAAADKAAADKAAADKAAADAAAAKVFNIDTFLNGYWKGGYEIVDKNNASFGQKGFDWFLYKGNDIYWMAGAGGLTTPEFTITSKTYDDTTGQLLINYKRNSNTETWADILTVDKTAMTMIGTQNNGAVALDYVKSDGVAATKYEGKNITNTSGTEKDKVDGGLLRIYSADKWNALSAADKAALVTVTDAEFATIPIGLPM